MEDSTDKTKLFLESRLLWGAVTLILAAIAYSGKATVTTSYILLVLAFLTGSFLIFRTGLPTRFRLISCLGLALGLALLSWWLQPSTTRPPIAKEIAEEVVAKLGKTHHKELESQFPDGFILFGLLEADKPLVRGFVPNWIDADWDTGRIIDIGNDTITLIVPKLKLTLSSNAVMIHVAHPVTLERKAGFVMPSIKVGSNLRVKINVVAADNPVVIALGFVKENNTH